MSKKAAKKWLEEAKHDLEIAEGNIKLSFYNVTAFYSQQAIEKLLKSILIYETGTAPKIHLNDELARLLPISEETRKYIGGTSEDYSMSRYPDLTPDVPHKSYRLEDAVKRIERAKKIFEILKDRYMEFDDE